MPTIRRPKTDNQRLQALESAKLKSDVTPPGSLAFSPAVLATLLAFLPNFRQQMLERGVALSAQSGSTSLADTAKERLKKFISHFFQVFNLGIDRGTYTADQRPHYLLDANQEELPQMDTEQQIQMWGNRVVDGEATRTAAGFPAMSNPTSGDVQAELTLYTTRQGDQSVKKEAYDNEQEDVEELRTDADDLIADIWDEVEFTFRKETPSSKRRKAREYGLVYVPRVGETPSPDDFSITGKCTEELTGTALDDVELKVMETGLIVFSNSEGNYFIPVLDAATYTLEAKKMGFNTKNIPGVVVTDGVITTLNITMKRATTPPPPGPPTPP